MDALRASLESDKSSSKKPKAKPTRFGGSVFSTSADAKDWFTTGI
jgi:hypothetical protein